MPAFEIPRHGLNIGYSNRLVRRRLGPGSIDMMDPTSLAIEFLCPICHVLPIDPVLAEDGFIYDRECIENFIAVRHADSGEIISPMTGERMGEALIYSDTVKQTIGDLTACEELENGMRGEWAGVNQGEPVGGLLVETKTKSHAGRCGRNGESCQMVYLWWTDWR